MGVYVIGGIKGGSGKTTVATNLVILCAAEGQDVLLVDADDQETATDFTILRNETREGGAGYTSIKLTGAAVRTEIQRLKQKYDHIIIDTGGRDTTSQRAALSVADMLIVPFVPRSFDIWTLEKVSGLVSEMRGANPDLQAYVFLNRADAAGQDNNDAAEQLKEHPELTYLGLSIGNRKAFGNASAQGLAVTELHPANDKASEEIITLFRHLFKVKTTLQAVGE